MDMLSRLLRRKAAKLAAAYTKKPSQPPTSFSASAHDNWAASVGSKTGVPYPASAQLKVPWRWTGSTAEFDGVERGGLRDTLNAGLLGVDALKQDVDSIKAAVNDLRSDVQALQEAPPARPFP